MHEATRSLGQPSQTSPFTQKTATETPARGSKRTNDGITIFGGGYRVEACN